MRLVTTALLCTFVAGCATSERPNVTRAASVPQVELPGALALSGASACLVRGTDGTPVIDRNGTPVRC